MLSRTQLLAQPTVDQQNLSGGTNVGFGEFANARYRGQTFVPSQTSLSALAFQLADLGSKDMTVSLTDVDQVTHLPTGSVLASWTIAAGDLSNTLTTYPLTPAYTTLTPGQEYGIYLAPTTAGVYADDYRNLAMNNSRPYSPGFEITNTNGVWTTENLSLVFKTLYPGTITRNSASGRGSASGRSLV